MIKCINTHTHVEKGFCANKDAFAVFFFGPVAGRVRSRHAGKNARGLQRRRRGCREAGWTAEPSAVESAHVAVTFALLPNAHVAVTVLLIVVAVVVVEAGVPVRVLLVIVVAAVSVVIVVKSN